MRLEKKLKQWVLGNLPENAKRCGYPVLVCYELRGCVSPNHIEVAEERAVRERFLRADIDADGYVIGDIIDSALGRIMAVDFYKLV